MGAARDLGQCRITSCLVAGCAGFLNAGNLRLAHCIIVDIADIDRIFVVFAVFIDANNDLDAAVDIGLTGGGRFLDLEFWHTGGHGFGHTTHFLDFFDQFPRGLGQFMGQAFDVI